uniref:Uncharacterized protein n=1 Tax=Branchiostoma floridae TaxID=7739 RepID=C3Y2E2_BRAFL|eukprot:XP_002609487.1 hypothetical protein BRAFLDRAFT_95581 [Branchiostoma floridae]
MRRSAQQPDPGINGSKPPRVSRAARRATCRGVRPGFPAPPAMYHELATALLALLLYYNTWDADFAYDDRGRKFKKLGKFLRRVIAKAASRKRWYVTLVRGGEGWDAPKSFVNNKDKIN